MKPSIRRRLTFSYGVVTAATLVTLGAATCALTHQFLMREVDTTLTMEYDDVVNDIRWSRSAATTICRRESASELMMWCRRSKK